MASPAPTARTVRRGIVVTSTPQRRRAEGSDAQSAGPVDYEAGRVGQPQGIVDGADQGLHRAPALSVGNAAGATGSVPTFTRRVRATGYAPRMVWVQVIARVSLAPLDPIPASSTREIVFATVAVVALSLAIVSVLITASVMGLAVVASPAA
jgi:hypothetical protein